jgi:hypothetical protein
MTPKAGSKIWGGRRRAGSLVIETVVAMAVVAIALLPLMGSYAGIQKSFRHSYQHAVAMELVDGEMEVLLAGEWHNFAAGPQPYMLHGAAATNLPPGKTVLTITGNRVRLEWMPDQHGVGGGVTREAVAK